MRECVTLGWGVVSYEVTSVATSLERVSRGSNKISTPSNYAAGALYYWRLKNLLHQDGCSSSRSVVKYRKAPPRTSWGFLGISGLSYNIVRGTTVLQIRGSYNRG